MVTFIVKWNQAKLPGWHGSGVWKQLWPCVSHSSIWTSSLTSHTTPPSHRLNSTCQWSQNPDGFWTPENHVINRSYQNPPKKATPVVNTEKDGWAQSRWFWTQWWSEVTLKRNPVIKEGKWEWRLLKTRKQTESVDLISYVLFLSCVFATVFKKLGDTCV